VIATGIPGRPEILLIGAVRGYAPEVPDVLAALDRFGPEAIGVGLSEEELQGLVEYFAGADAEEVVPLTQLERQEVTGLTRYGEVRVPSPAYIGILEWAQARKIPVAPLDASDIGAADMFTRHIGYIELVRRTLREHRLGRAPPPADGPDEYALAWDRTLSSGRGSRAFLAERDTFLAASALELAATHERVGVVVDRERFALVARGMGADEAGPSR
jgi:hypothetical protein